MLRILEPCSVDAQLTMGQWVMGHMGQRMRMGHMGHGEVPVTNRPVI